MAACTATLTSSVTFMQTCTRYANSRAKEKRDTSEEHLYSDPVGDPTYTPIDYYGGEGKGEGHLPSNPKRPTALTILTVKHAIEKYKQQMYTPRPLSY